MVNITDSVGTLSGLEGNPACVACPIADGGLGGCRCLCFSVEAVRYRHTLRGY